MQQEWLNRLNNNLGIVSLGSGIQIEILHWCYNAALADNQPHSHTHYEICLAGYRGSGRYIVEGKPHPVQNGDLLIARPRVGHQILNDKQHLELYWVAFRECGANKKSSSQADSKNEIGLLWRQFAQNHSRLVVSSPSTVSLWQSLHAISQGDYAAGKNDQIRSLVKTLFIDILQAGAGTGAACAEPAASSSPTDWAVRTALLFLEDNLAHPLKMEDIAGQTHLSPRHLSRLFAAQTGVTPMHYLEALRLERAASKLLHTALPIKVIATQCGFASVQYFSEVFQKKIHVSPGNYRKRKKPLS